MIFDGPLELVELARDANSGPRPFKRLEAFSWPGRVCPPNDWARAAKFLTEPWPEVVRKIKAVVEEVKRSRELPLPKSIKRKARWDADDGEVDVDRAMHGDPEFYRATRRHRTSQSMHVALISNLDDVEGHAIINSSGVYFRSVAAIALTDILEEVGYSVEIVIWSRGMKVYPEPDHEQFMACKIKKAGEVLDFDAMADAMSGWFTMQAMVAALAANPKVKPISKGEGIEPAMEKFWNEDGSINWYEYGIDYWLEYLDLEENIQVFPVPMMLGTWGSGMRAAIDGAKEVLEKIVGENQ